MPDIEIRSGNVDAAGKRTHYMEAGHGPAVIIAAGLGLRGQFYHHSFGAFARAGFRLIVPDAPGTRTGNRFGMDVHESVTWLAGFARAVDAERAWWIGHSVGAQYVVALAARMPHRVLGIVLAAPAGAPVRRRLLHEFTALMRVIPRETVGALAAVARDYVRSSPLRYFGTWRKAAEYQALEDAHRVQCPALILVGDRDTVPTASYLEQLRTRIPRAELRIIPGGAHGLPRDRAADFNRIAVEYLRSFHGGAP